VADTVNVDVQVITEDEELVVDLAGQDLGGNPVPLDPTDPDAAQSDPDQVTLAPGDGPHQHLVRPVKGLVAGQGGAVTFSVQLAQGGDPVPVVVPYVIQAGAARTIVASPSVRPRTD
jgi:hypothetical protein